MITVGMYFDIQCVLRKYINYMSKSNKYLKLNYVNDSEKITYSFLPELI
jgi:hypothetical protein